MLPSGRTGGHIADYPVWPQCRKKRAQKQDDRAIDLGMWGADNVLSDAWEDARGRGGEGEGREGEGERTLLALFVGGAARLPVDTAWPACGHAE